MKRFIITSPRFTGQINVLYGLDCKLQFIDFMKCDLTEEQTTYFKDRLPVLHTGTALELLHHFGNSRLDCVEEGYHVSFEMWWNAYDLKRNRARCEKLWSKLSEADRVNAYFKLKMYERHQKFQCKDLWMVQSSR